MTASVYGRNFAVKFHRSEMENLCHAYKLHRFVSFFVLLMNFKMQLVFFNFSSEAEHVLALFLSFGQIEPQCSYKVCPYKKRSVLYAKAMLPLKW